MASTQCSIQQELMFVKPQLIEVAREMYGELYGCDGLDAETGLATMFEVSAKKPIEDASTVELKTLIKSLAVLEAQARLNLARQYMAQGVAA